MPILFAFPKYETLAKALESPDFSHGNLSIKHFPDGESLVTLQTDVKDKDVILVCGLDDADQKMAPLLFFTKTARELGAKSIGLVTPYLGYMRQDKRFNPGETVSSNIFAKFLSSLFDWLLTADPHLHRHESLDEIFTVPTTTLHASALLAAWIKKHIKKPIVIGPDEESRQWVQDVAQQADIPFVVLKKVRHGDKNVEITVPDIETYQDHTPVLVDDIISTAQTMIETIKHLNSLKTKPPICLGIHAVFAHDAYAKLKNSGVAEIVTTNTISHETNKIDVAPLFAQALEHKTN
ncbi:ribose-phosphate pyrophosphokinase [Candidatus Babeliales bacterium]|nr:ribose-phosphate pyrophosphokinase [Candidatus Babeliales bacterium]